MKKLLLSLAVIFILIIYKVYGQGTVNPRIQINKDQKLYISCAQADEEDPRREIKIDLLLLEPSTKDVTIEFIVGPNSSISQPTVDTTQKITIEAKEFPKAEESAKTVQKEIKIILSNHLMDKDERVYLFIKNRPAMGIVELNISCDKTAAANATAPKPADANTPVTVTAVTSPAAASGSTTPGAAAAASTPAKPNIKALCECISVARNKEIIIPPYIPTSKTSPETNVENVSFQLSLKRGCRIPEDTVVKIKLVTVNTTDSKPELTASYFQLKKKDWPDSSTNDARLLTFTTSIRLTRVDSFTADKIYYIALDNCTEGDNRQVVRESMSGSFNPNKPFWVELGANFDLIDEIKPNNMFFGVFMYKRDIKRKSLTKKANHNWSLFGGVYNSRSVTEETSSKFSPLVYFDPNKSLRPVDSARRDVFWSFADSGKIKSTTSVRSVGLFISPQYRLTKGDANEDGLHLFISPWIEMVWQRFNTSYDFSEMKLYDSFPVRYNTDSFQSVKARPQPESEDIRSHYFGLGTPLYFKEGELNLYFAPIFGKTNQRLAARENIIDSKPFTNPFYNPPGLPTVPGSKEKNVLSTLEVPEKRWNWFYLFQFRLSEEHYGIAFTGEVRGLIKNYYKPVISLALSKKFDLNKLLTFGLAKSGD